jgi:RNA polymerase sigma-70 factor (ECF subfamily)
MTRLHSDEESRQESSQDVEPKEYRALLHRFLMSLVHNTQDAQDLAQETYLRYLQVDKAAVIRKPKAYLFRVAQNLVYEMRLDRARERKVLTFDTDLSESQADGAAHTGGADPTDIIGNPQLLNHALSRIPPGYRRVLLMYKRDGMSAEEIARELGITRRSVHVYIARAVGHARAALWK